MSCAFPGQVLLRIKKIAAVGLNTQMRNRIIPSVTAKETPFMLAIHRGPD